MNKLTHEGIIEVDTITRFQVKWEMVDGRKGLDEAGSYFLMDQQGNFYRGNPATWIDPVHESAYKRIVPLFDIRGIWMSITEIEGCFEDFEELTGTTFPQMRKRVTE